MKPSSAFWEKSVKAIPLVLMAAIFLIPVLFLSASHVRGEAASNLLGRYSCSKVKGYAESAPETLFNMWAEAKIQGDGTGRVSGQ